MEEVALAGHHAIMVMKNNHARCPKAWLESKMSEFPGGTWIILEGRTKKQVDLLYMGYKYNKRTVLTFIFSKGASSTTAGRPYKAHFPDIYGNIHVRSIRRPKVLNIYFNDYGAVDAHNQARQGHLALEECWVTSDPYFWIWTTIMGMEVTDLWKIYRQF